MFSHVKFSHIKEATLFAWKAASTFFIFFWFALVALYVWSTGFSPVSSAYAFFIPKIIIILVGIIFTGIPFYYLLPIAFLPVRQVAPVFFIAFIAMFVH